MIRCEHDERDGQAKVTFDIPAEGTDAPVSVVGGLQRVGPLPPRRWFRRGQSLRASVLLDAGRRYAFRYLADGGRWFNDDAADGYEPDRFGGSDSVVDLTAPR